MPPLKAQGVHGVCREDLFSRPHPCDLPRVLRKGEEIVYSKGVQP